MLGYIEFHKDEADRLFSCYAGNKFYFNNSKNISLRSKEQLTWLNGIYFSKQLEYSFYGFWNSEIYEIETRGSVLTDEEKYCTNKIKIGRKLSNEEKFDILLKSNSYTAKKLVAEYDKCPVEILSLLTDYKNCTVRYAVACNTNCPKAVLIELSKDEDDEVRYAVVYNTNCPKDVLIELSKDKNKYVRIAALKKLGAY